MGGTEFQPSGKPPATDATGEADFGHIDAFVLTGPETWTLSGEWGSVSLSRPEVRLTFEL